MDDIFWSDEELKASVEAYVEMQHNERTGQLIVKKQYYKKLVEMFGRSEQAFEHRMQNISYVLSLMGRRWMTGLKPEKNIEPLVAAQIEQLLEQVSGQKALRVAAFEVAVREAAGQKDLQEPAGNIRPKRRRVSIAEYQHDADVKAWVLQQAAGICESCEKPAPFQGPDGLPYLELHYIHELADGGADAVSNAVALCPNCHREIHHGANTHALEAWLYDTVHRLERD